MNAIGNETELKRDARAIDVWENEGGAPRRDSVAEQYGRRVEADRSWTIYHVFSGIPASEGIETMTGLSRQDATDRMLSLNRRNDERREGRGSIISRGRPAQSTTEDCPS